MFSAYYLDRCLVTECSCYTQVVSESTLGKFEMNVTKTLAWYTKHFHVI